MNSNSNHLQSPFLPKKTLSSLHGTYRVREFRVWRRRRLKFDKKIRVGCQLDNFLISQFPSVNSLDLIAPAIGFISGVTLYISRLKSNNRNSKVSHVGEWVLVTSPTPFNRFVLLRCPSLTFEGSELLEDLNEKLVKEDRHFVKLISGKIQGRDLDDDSSEENLVYQRVCVSTSDGGVVSLDWPAKLDLMEEHGMDTTLLLVPGSAEGSMNKNIRSFVCESLKRGCFPVVMNPRGCAGSPLTTARLFTAADSDDICTAVQFINRARPWNTLMAVGWGHGANMLTKYLAEVAERTPLTAATCIDNPFDLEEATRSFPHHVAVDQKLTSGLIDILRSNKELFQGRARGFNVEKALSAKSLRDFEREISMVSYGFKAIEEFYSKSSTRELVGNVKIPLLFIQSDDGTVPPFSIPRSSIAENPFTTLLLCSCIPSSTMTSEKSTLPWCQHFSIEWLTAVELGLLKGRHPLLKDVDVSINPSKGLTLVESRASNKNSGGNKILNLTPLDASNGYLVDPIEDVVNENATDNVPSGSQRNLAQGAKSQVVENFDMLEQSSPVDAEVVKEMGDNPVDNERSQVLQTAQVIMNMLDVTMPGTLEEEQKKKVLSAMEQGETLMKALEGSVPDDVRGKLATAVSEIVQTQGRISMVPNASSEVKTKIEETLRKFSSTADGYKNVRSPEQMKLGNEMSGGTDMKQSGMESPPGELESDLQPKEMLQKSLDQGQSQSVSNSDVPSSGSKEVSDVPSSGSEEVNESQQSQGKVEVPGEKVVQYSGYDESGSGTESNLNKHSSTEKETDSDNIVGEPNKINEGNEMTHMSMKEANGFQENEETHTDDSADKNKFMSAAKPEESVSPMIPSPDSPSVEKEQNSLQQSEDKIVQPMEDQNKQDSTKSEESTPSFPPTSNPPSFNVSQALDALTGFDDSTQMAVNSVFGVLENMIAQLEDENGQENDGKQDKSEDEERSSASEESPIASETENMLINKESGLSSSGLLQSCSHPVPNRHVKVTDLHPYARNNLDEKQLIQSGSTSLEKNAGSSDGSNVSNHVDKDKRRMSELIDSTISAENSDKVRHICKVPLCVTVNPYGDSLYNEYLRRYLLSKMPNTKSLDLDSTTDLLLDYFPEEGQWKLLDIPGNGADPVSNTGADKNINGRGKVIHSPAHANDRDEIIETSYVILDTEKEQKPIEEYRTEDGLNEKPEEEVFTSESVSFVKNIISDSLKVEVGRRLGFHDMKEMDLAHDLEHVAEAVSLAVGRNKELTWSSESKESASRKVGTLHVEHIVQAMFSAVNDTIYLKKVLPVGVIVGSSLATLKKYFSVASQNDNGYSIETTLDQTNNVEKSYSQRGDIGNDHKLVPKKEQYSDIDSSVSVDDEPEAVNKDPVMVGAVTAALGASAILVHNQSKDQYECDENVEVPDGPFSENVNCQKEHGKILDEAEEKNQSNIVSNLAEKAMSVAGPVVPTKSDGEVDQERLVAMLSDLGQKGGMLRMVGKIALLWGGIRGAMSLTDRLISFLHIADRPLLQRLLAFACMVLVLWSPVVIPMFPTLVQSWATHTSCGITEYVCVIGLYTALIILIILWGKRIRGYKDPLEQYGLNLTSSVKLLDFLKGLMGGVVLVLSIHSINSLLGCVHFSWSSALLSSSQDAMAWLKVCGRLLMLAGRGIVTATVVVIVEEILFRSWLPQEIAVDLGYHQAVIISGFVFSILQRSLRSIPGLWLLSIALDGVRQRSKGSLSMPIGMRAGIVASSFIFKTGGFLIYNPNYPIWLAGTHPLQPFDGAVGLACCLILAILVYPQQPLWSKKLPRPVRE